MLAVPLLYYCFFSRFKEHTMEISTDTYRNAAMFLSASLDGLSQSKVNVNINERTKRVANLT